MPLSYGATSQSSRSFGSSVAFDATTNSSSGGRHSTTSATMEDSKLLLPEMNDYLFSFEDILDEEETRYCFIEYLRNDLTNESLAAMSNHVDDNEEEVSTQLKRKLSSSLNSSASLNISNGESKYYTLPSSYYYCLERIDQMKIKKSNTNKMKLAIEIYNDYINDENWKNQDTLLDMPHSIRDKAMQVFSRLMNEDKEYVCPRRISISSTPKDVTKLANSLIEASRSRNNSNVSTSSVPSNVDSSTRKRGDSSAANDVLTNGCLSMDDGFEVDVFAGDLTEENDIPNCNIPRISNVDSISVDEFFREHYLNVFDEIEAHIVFTLKGLCFPLFLKSDRFHRFLELKQKEETIGQLLSKIATLKPFTHQNFIRFTQNLNVRSVTIENFALIKYYMLNEDFWSRVRKGKNYEVFISSENYRMEPSEDNSIYFFKYEIVFPFSCQNVMTCLLEVENRKQYDKLLKSTEQLDRFPKTDSTLAYEIRQEVYRMKWPVKDRSFTYCVSSVYDSSSDIYFLYAKSVNSDKEKSIKDTIKGLSLTGWAFKPIDENTCKYYQLTGVDFKGQVPVKIVQQLLKFRAKNYVKEVLEFLKKSEKNGWKQHGANQAVEILIENGPISFPNN